MFRREFRRQRGNHDELADGRQRGPYTDFAERTERERGHRPHQRIYQGDRNLKGEDQLSSARCHLQPSALLGRTVPDLITMRTECHRRFLKTNCRCSCRIRNKFSRQKLANRRWDNATEWAWDRANEKVVRKQTHRHKNVFPLELCTMPGFCRIVAYYLR